MRVIDKKSSVLIIEDDPSVSDALSELIESWGYQVVVAESLPLARIKINNQKFNIILLDLLLKKTSSVILLEQIRGNLSSINHSTPIILHSGNLETDLFKKYHGEISDALVKPSSSEIIKEKLALWCNKKHTPPAPAKAASKD